VGIIEIVRKRIEISIVKVSKRDIEDKVFDKDAVE
jgi:hypothetical protein